MAAIGDRLATTYCVMESELLRYNYICPDENSRLAWEGVLSYMCSEINKGEREGCLLQSRSSVLEHTTPGSQILGL
ncbi:hypothetical protein HWV62_5157 [Athelia sp. TMB]|nr:hypothetical protein HWV62_5157 [Athelia sp. TMB]